jgi:hypothetical protein
MLNVSRTEEESSLRIGFEEGEDDEHLLLVRGLLLAGELVLKRKNRRPK